MEQTISNRGTDYEMVPIEPYLYDPLQDQNREPTRSNLRPRVTAHTGFDGRWLNEYTENSFPLKSSISSKTSTQRLTGNAILCPCTLRSDDTGPWDFLKAWYIFWLHACACTLLVGCMIGIDGNLFQIGFGPSIFVFDSPLHQAQVTGLISIGLVIIRLIAGSCSVLISWRVVYVLLEKRGISLAELSRMMTWRTPIFPCTFQKSSMRWSLWALVIVLLLWPAGFAAPFASSAVSWIPAIRIRDGFNLTSVASVGENGNWGALLYAGSKANAIMGATVMAARDPAYAFNPSQGLARRHFQTNQIVPSGSKIDIVTPYFDVNVEWMDCSSDSTFDYIGDSTQTNVNSPNVYIRNPGTIATIAKDPWSDSVETPTSAETYEGTQLFSVLIQTVSNGTVINGEHIWHGTNTICPVISDIFGKLPNHEQYMFAWDYDGVLAAYDCYVCGIARIKAGKFSGKDCTVNSTASNAEYATCDRKDDSLEGDWLVGNSLAFMTEVLMYTVMLNYSQPWIDQDLDTYAKGMLTLGYESTWSGLMQLLTNSTETAQYKPAQNVVAASINRSKLYIWLGMNAALTAAMVLVLLGLPMVRTKTIRNSSVAALTIDLSEISHSSQAAGLCNAAALSGADCKLPRMRWAEEISDLEFERPDTYHPCQRRVVFAKDGFQDRNQSFS